MLFDKRRSSARWSSNASSRSSSAWGRGSLIHAPGRAASLCINRDEGAQASSVLRVGGRGDVAGSDRPRSRSARAARGRSRTVVASGIERRAPRATASGSDPSSMHVPDDALVVVQVGRWRWRTSSGRSPGRGGGHPPPDQVAPSRIISSGVSASGLVTGPGTA